MAAPTHTMRLKLVFDSENIPLNDLTALKKCWFLLNTDNVKTIASLGHEIQCRFSLDPNKSLTLYLDDCVLPFWEAIGILRENDQICVSCDKETAQSEKVASPWTGDSSSSKSKKKKKKKHSHSNELETSFQYELPKSGKRANVKTVEQSASSSSDQEPSTIDMSFSNKEDERENQPSKLKRKRSPSPDVCQVIKTVKNQSMKAQSSPVQPQQEETLKDSKSKRHRIRKRRNKNKLQELNQANDNGSNCPVMTGSDGGKDGKPAGASNSRRKMKNKVTMSGVGGLLSSLQGSWGSANTSVKGDKPQVASSPKVNKPQVASSPKVQKNGNTKHVKFESASDDDEPEVVTKEHSSPRSWPTHKNGGQTATVRFPNSPAVEAASSKDMVKKIENKEVQIIIEEQDSGFDHPTTFSPEYDAKDSVEVKDFRRVPPPTQNVVSHTWETSDPPPTSTQQEVTTFSKGPFANVKVYNRKQRRMNKKAATVALSKEEQLNTEASNRSTIYENASGSQSPREAPSKKRQPPQEDDSTSEDKVPEPVLPPKDYSVYPLLERAPSKGDTIAYKILEMNASYCPEISDYKEAVVLDYNEKTQILQMELKQQINRKSGRFELEVEDEDEILTSNQTDLKVTEIWSSMVEPRLVTA